MCILYKYINKQMNKIIHESINQSIERYTNKCIKQIKQNLGAKIKNFHFTLLVLPRTET